MKVVSTVLTVTCVALFAGCSATPSTPVTSSPVSAPTDTSPSPTPLATSSASFTAAELALLNADGWSLSDPAAPAFIESAHKLCVSFATIGDEDIFQALKESADEKRKTAGRILMLLCQDSRYIPLIVASEVSGSVASGTYYVGTGAGQIAAGKYKTIGAVKNCYWVRKDKDGDIIDNDLVANAPGGVRLTVKASDYQVTMSRCGIWVPDKD